MMYRAGEFVPNDRKRNSRYKDKDCMTDITSFSPFQLDAGNFSTQASSVALCHDCFSRFLRISGLLTWVENDWETQGSMF